jgi:tyrosyl-tRNA synthetase
MGQRPQVDYTMRLLPGTDGVQKMSKSLGNTIDLEDAPTEKYGKVMSIPDSALLDYFELATDVSDEELSYIRKQLAERSVNPMELKKRLAREIVAMFHGEQAAREAEREWVRVFSERAEPEDARRIVVTPDPVTLKVVVNVASVLVAEGLAQSKAEARRLIKQGAVDVNGRKVSADEAAELSVRDGDILRIGRHEHRRIMVAESQKTS